MERAVSGDSIPIAVMVGIPMAFVNWQQHEDDVFNGGGRLRSNFVGVAPVIGHSLQHRPQWGCREGYIEIAHLLLALR